MSLSRSDCFSDLLCGEASNTIFSLGRDYSLEYSSDIDSVPPDAEESIAGLLADERDLVRISNRSNYQPIDASVRAGSVAWILKEWQKFKAELLKRLSKGRGVFGDDIQRVVNTLGRNMPYETSESGGDTWIGRVSCLLNDEDDIMAIFMVAREFADGKV